MEKKRNARGRRLTRTLPPTGTPTEQVARLWRDMNRLMDELERELERIENKQTQEQEKQDV